MSVEAAEQVMGLVMPLVRLAEMVVALLVLTWAFKFQSSFQHRSSSSNNAAVFKLDHLYSVLHPLLMVIGFIILTGEAITAHRWSGKLSRPARKSTHLCLQGLALVSAVMGIWVKFHGERGVAANFYTLHSWMGILCLFLFSSQWAVGFMSFWHRGESRRSREAVLPWHVFIGFYTYGLSVATAESGLLEKLTLLQNKGKVESRSVEAVLVNALGIGLAFLGGIVVFAAVSRKNHTGGGNDGDAKRIKIKN